MATIIQKERIPAVSETLKALEQVTETMEGLTPGSDQCAVFDMSRRNTINNTIQYLKFRTGLRFKTRVVKEMMTSKEVVNGEEVEVETEVEKLCVWRIA